MHLYINCNESAQYISLFKKIYYIFPATFPADIKSKVYNPFNINTRRQFTPLLSGNNNKNLSNH